MKRVLEELTLRLDGFAWLFDFDKDDRLGRRVTEREVDPSAGNCELRNDNARVKGRPAQSTQHPEDNPLGHRGLIREAAGSQPVLDVEDVVLHSAADNEIDSALLSQ